MDTNGTNGKIEPRTEIRVSVRVDAVLMGRINRVAKLSGISSSDVVRMALNQQLPAADEKAALKSETMIGDVVINGRGFKAVMGRGKKGKAA